MNYKQMEYFGVPENGKYILKITILMGNKTSSFWIHCVQPNLYLAVA